MGSGGHDGRPTRRLAPTVAPIVLTWAGLTWCTTRSGCATGSAGGCWRGIGIPGATTTTQHEDGAFGRVGTIFRLLPGILDIVPLLMRDSQVGEQRCRAEARRYERQDEKQIGASRHEAPRKEP